MRVVAVSNSSEVELLPHGKQRAAMPEFHERGNLLHPCLPMAGSGQCVVANDQYSLGHCFSRNSG